MAYPEPSSGPYMDWAWAGVTLLGGCPFFPGSTGNVCTEDVVHMLHLMGVETGIDLDKLIEAARLAQELIGRPLPGRVMQVGKAFTLPPIPEALLSPGQRATKSGSHQDPPNTHPAVSREVTGALWDGGADWRRA